MSLLCSHTAPLLLEYFEHPHTGQSSMLSEQTAVTAQLTHTDQTKGKQYNTTDDVQLSSNPGHPGTVTKRFTDLGNVVLNSNM